MVEPETRRIRLIAAMTCPHSGKRRMILNLICQQPAADPPRVDFLISAWNARYPARNHRACNALHETIYQLTRPIPNCSKQELRNNTGNHGARTLLVPAIRSCTKNTLEAMKAKKIEIISIAFIQCSIRVYSDGISGIYLSPKSEYRCRKEKATMLINDLISTWSQPLNKPLSLKRNT